MKFGQLLGHIQMEASGAISATGQVDAAPRPARGFGIAALLVSVAALACAIVAYHVLEEPRPNTHSKLTIKLGPIKFERETKTPPDVPDLRQLITPWRMRLIGIGIGVIAILLSVVSWIRHEGFWLGFAACTFAAAAAAWIIFATAFALLLMSGALFAFMPERRIETNSA
jgi:hypothetical protein